MTQKLRVLIAEGPSGKAASALREFFPSEQGGFELTEVSGVSTLLASLKLINPEVILLDLALANPDVLGTVRLIHRTKPDVPLVVIGDSGKKEIAVASLREGATDYFLKNHIDPRSVERVLRGALERNALQGLADSQRDPLTGLHTREGFLTLGTHVMETGKERNGNLVLLCARFESLERIRKNCGENAAGASLREIATLLTRSFRRTDVIGRIGEPQFAALAVDAIEPSAPVLLQRLKKRLEALNSEARARGPVELRMAARFWTGSRQGTFAGFLDEVEASLRQPERPGEAEPQLHGSVLSK
jgi:diguanylate cyclase (GGDEF)-like protein